VYGNTVADEKKESIKNEKPGTYRLTIGEYKREIGLAKTPSS